MMWIASTKTCSDSIGTHGVSIVNRRESNGETDDVRR